MRFSFFLWIGLGACFGSVKNVQALSTMRTASENTLRVQSTADARCIMQGIFSETKIAVVAAASTVQWHFKISHILNGNCGALKKDDVLSVPIKEVTFLDPSTDIRRPRFAYAGHVRAPRTGGAYELVLTAAGGHFLINDYLNDIRELP